jgi:hypothetical protein
MPPPSDDDPAPVQPPREVQPHARDICDGYHFITSASDTEFCREELRRRLAASRQIALPAPPVNVPLPPLRPVDPDPPATAPYFPMPSRPLTPPADATECWGYWRICHFY